MPQRKIKLKSVLLFLTVLIIFSYIDTKRRGIATFHFGEGMTSRQDYFETLSQNWVVLSFMISCTFCYLMYYYDRLFKVQKIYFVFLCVFYILFQTSLGNRSELAILLFFFIGYYLYRKGKPLNLKMALAIFFIFILSFYVTLFRDSSTRGLDSSTAISVVTESNEFMFPIQTLYYTINDNWNLRFGETYLLQPIQTAIPRSIYPNKPMSLGAEFTYKTFGEGWMGYAYTPITEAYLNFGLVGPFIIFILISLFFDKLVKKSNKKGGGFWYFIFYSMSFNFLRGDFSTTVYLLAFLYFTYIINTKLSGKTIAKTMVKQNNSNSSTCISV